MNLLILNMKKLPSIVLIPGYDTQEERISHIKLYKGELYTNNIVEWVKNNTKHVIGTVDTLESEALLFKQEAKKPIKPKSKEKEEDVTSFEEGFSTGLRRTVKSEVEREMEDAEDDEDVGEDDEEFMQDIVKEQEERKASKVKKTKESKKITHL